MVVLEPSVVKYAARYGTGVSTPNLADLVTAFAGPAPSACAPLVSRRSRSRISYRSAKSLLCCTCSCALHLDDWKPPQEVTIFDSMDARLVIQNSIPSS